MKKKEPKARTPQTIAQCFERLPDPRVRRRCRHKLIDILVMGLCSALTGGEGFNDMELFGKVKRQWRMPDTEEGAPEDLCVLEDGRIVVSDTHYYRVAIFDQEGNLLSTFGKEGRGEGEFFYPVGIVKDDEDNVYVCEYGGNDRVQKFTPDGKFLFAFGSFGTGPGQFQRPSGMARTEKRIYVADAINNRVLIFADDGKFVGLLGEGPIFRFPYDLALGADRSLYVVEYQAGRVSKVGLDGRLMGRYGSVGTGEGKLRTPWGVAFDAAGARLLVADTGNRRMVELKL